MRGNAKAVAVMPQSVGLPLGSSSTVTRGRVLMVTSSFPRWLGDETTPFILHLAQDLQSLGWQPLVLAPHAPGAEVAERLEGIEVQRFRYLWPESAQTVCYSGGALVNLRKRRLNALKLPALVGAELAAVARNLFAQNFDIVHSHWILPQGLTTGLVARVLGVPHVATVHGGDVFALRGPFLRRCKRTAFKLADAITVNSSATGKAVAQIGHGEVPVFDIPMGATPFAPPSHAVNSVRDRYRRGSGPLVVFVGRLVEEKGVGDFIEAVADLRDSHPDVTGLVVGEGQDRLAFERRTRELGLEGTVRFAGWVASAELGPLLAASDVFVAPSKRSPDGWVEAQGLTIVEAMLAGVPVVATDTGGVVDLVRNRETGLLVPESSPKNIADAVRQIDGNPALRQHVTKNALELVERNYTRTVSAMRFSSLFQRLISGQRIDETLARRPT